MSLLFSAFVVVSSVHFTGVVGFLMSMAASTFLRFSTSNGASLAVVSVGTKWWISVKNLSSGISTWGSLGCSFFSGVLATFERSLWCFGFFSTCSVSSGTSIILTSVGPGWYWTSDFFIFFTTFTVGRALSSISETGTISCGATPSLVRFVGIVFGCLGFFISMLATTFSEVSSSRGASLAIASVGTSWWISEMNFSTCSGNLTVSSCPVGWSTFSTAISFFCFIVFLISTISLPAFSVSNGTSFSYNSVDAGWNWISCLQIFFIIWTFNRSSLFRTSSIPDSSGISTGWNGISTFVSGSVPVSNSVGKTFLEWISSTPVGNCINSWRR